MASFSMAQDVVSLSEFRARLTQRISALESGPGCVVVTRNGRAAAIVLSPREYDRLQYGTFVRSKIARSLDAIGAGKAVSHKKVMSDARRLLRGGTEEAD